MLLTDYVTLAKIAKRTSRSYIWIMAQVLKVADMQFDMGFTSVMYDASAKPFEDNVAETRNVVEYAHERGASVEAELGHILTSKGRSC